RAGAGAGERTAGKRAGDARSLLVRGGRGWGEDGGAGAQGRRLHRVIAYVTGLRRHVLLARARSRSREPLNLLRSTFPDTPLTDPVLVYCQTVQVGNPLGMVGDDAEVQCATHSGLLADMPVQLPVQVFHQPAVV